MIATEEVARTKWCPHSRRFSATGSYNRDGVRLTEKCVASECMAWKWSSGFSPEELEKRKEWNPNPDVPKGYCGA